MPETAARHDPATAFRFTVRFDNFPPGGFTDCTGLQMETEVQEYREGGVNTHTWRFATRSKQTHVTLKRGIVDKALWDWYQDIARGKMQFRDGTSLSRAHEVAHELQGEIRGRLRGADVLIHLEPEDSVRED